MSIVRERIVILANLGVDRTDTFGAGWQAWHRDGLDGYVAWSSVVARCASGLQQRDNAPADLALHLSHRQTAR